MGGIFLRIQELFCGEVRGASYLLIEIIGLKSNFIYFFILIGSSD